MMKQINYTLNLGKWMTHLIIQNSYISAKTDGTKYDFNPFLFPLKFIEKIHNYEITLDQARNYRRELRILRNKLNNDYNPTNHLKKTKDKNNVLESARKLLDPGKDTIVFF